MKVLFLIKESVAGIQNTLIKDSFNIVKTIFKVVMIQMA